MEFFFLLPLIFLPYIIFFLYPIAFVKNPVRRENLINPPKLFLYSYVFHIHTQFSYDSLGKPEDVKRALLENDLDFAVITDHEVDHFKHFQDEKIIVGVEKKLNDERGKLLGDLIELGELKIISHHFRKYRWKLERKKEYLFELINLKDALVENRRGLIFYLLLAPFIYPFMKNSYLRNFVKVIDAEKYIRKYLKEGWENKVIGGLDHHVKIYVREVGIRFLFPSYSFSFRLLRNFLLSSKPIKNKEEFIKALRNEINLISFSEKPSLVWNDGKKLFVYAPYPNVLVKVFSKNGIKTFESSSLELELPQGSYIVCGYRYAFRFWKFYFGLKPLFVSDLINVN
ncbi:hypothetical protein JCM9492_06270 [Aquifex pyrophilus]